MAHPRRALLLMSVSLLLALPAATGTAACQDDAAWRDTVGQPADA